MLGFPHGELLCSKLLNARIVAPGCNAEIRGESEHDVCAKPLNTPRQTTTWEASLPICCQKLRAQFTMKVSEVTKSWHVELIFPSANGECVAVLLGVRPML